MAAVIELTDASLTYKTEAYTVTAVRPTSLRVQAGDYLTVTGASGSGKSSLLNLMGLLVRPTGGEVAVGGVNVAGLSDARVSATRGDTIGFVFQAFHLLRSSTVAENVELPLVYAAAPLGLRRAAVARVLDAVGLSHRAQALPGELSGGERQRAAIARAVVRGPRLLLCDEPTGNLDTRAAGQVIELLNSIAAQGTALVIVTHNANVAAQGRRRVQVVDALVTESEPE